MNKGWAEIESINNVSMQALKEKKFTIHLEKNEDDFYLTIPKLNLKSSGVDLQDAYDELEKKKEKLYGELIRINAENLILKHEEGPSDSSHKLNQHINKVPSMVNELKIFFFKMMIFFSFTVVIIIIGMGLLDATYRKMRYKIGTFTDAPQKVKEDRLQRYSKVIKEMSPYIHKTYEIITVDK